MGHFFNNCLCTNDGSSCPALVKSTKYDVYFSNTAIICIVVGVILTLTAFFYPVDWEFELDTSLTAAQNEERRADRVDIQNFVYALSVTGMVLVTAGGVISAFILTKYILLDECVQTTDEGACPGSQHLHHSTPSIMPEEVLAQRTQNTSSKSLSKDGQNAKLVESDHLQMNSASGQYGSTR